MKSNPMLKNFRDQFENLLDTVVVNTAYSILNIIISYNSKYAVAVTKKDESEYYIQMYSLMNYALEFEEKVGGDPNDYIKIKEVEQNSSGTKFATVYFNDGKFRLRTFGTKNRTKAEIESNELNINDLLDLKDFTMAISGFPDPYINCCWVGDDRIFVSLFYNYDLTHYHFIWNVNDRRIDGRIVTH